MNTLSRKSLELGRQIVFALLAVIVTNGSVQAQPSYQPVLPVQIRTAVSVPLLERALRDPDLADHQIHSATEAVKRKEQIQALATEAKGKSPASLVSLYQEILTLSGSLACYYADGIDAEANPMAEKEARQSVIKYSNLLRGVVDKKSPLFGQATYLYLSNKYLIKSMAGLTVDTLRSLQGSGTMVTSLKRRSEFLLALVEVELGKSQQIPSLRQAASALNKEAQVAAGLIIARAQAGINSSGKKVRSSTASYRSSLKSATAIGASNDSRLQEAVLATAVGIWRTAEGSTATWSQAPIDLKSNKNSPVSSAILERQALELWAQGKAAPALKLYQSLSEKYDGEAQMEPLDRRAIDFHRDLYHNDRNAKRYESALNQVHAKYSSTHAGHRHAAQILAYVTTNSSKLISDEIARTANQRATSQERANAIKLIERYLIKFQSSRDKEKFTTAIAQLQALNGQHSKSAQIYVQLASESSPSKKGQYLVLAAAAQRIAAKWPETAPWKLLPRERLDERSALLGIYQQIQSLRPEVDWATQNHIGQLLVHTNQSEQAFSLWTKSLKTSPEGREAAQAAGFMLVSYKMQKQWKNLEQIARLAKGANLPAKLDNKVVDVNAMLAISLLEGGKSALNENAFAIAVKKLDEFVRGFHSSNGDEGMFYLATALHGDNQHEKSITTLQDLTQQYRNSRFNRQALLNGGDWSGAMAYEENTIYFFDQFVKRYPSDSEISRIRQELIDIYLGRRLYAEATSLMKAQVEDKRTSQPEREDTALRLIRTEEKYGNSAKATTTADYILMKMHAPSIRAEALAIKARAMEASGKAGRLDNLVNELNALEQTAATQEALGEIRFLMANAKVKGLLRPVNSLQIIDPQSTLSSRFKEFSRAKLAFHEVCASGDSSFCVPALHRLARVAERLISIIEDISIPATYDANIVNRFEKEKQQMIVELSQESLASDEKAGKLATNGFTHPDWIQQIYWQNGGDTNLDRVSGEDGRGYLQWPVSAKN